MIPEPPPDCRRQNFLRFLISLIPPVSCLILALLGQWTACALVFTATFLLIAYGTLTPHVQLFGPLVTQLPAAQAKDSLVWLTLDDGPDPATTPRLLEILDRHHAKAAFFLIGDRAKKHPDLVREIAARGHLIGNHSQTHPVAKFWSLRPAAMWQEIAGCQQTLTQILGTAPIWFRPPVGHHNLFVTPPLRALGLTMAMWNCRGFDGVEKDPAKILQRIARSLQPSSIILLHDTTTTCAEVLEGTLKLLQERGLKTFLPAAL